MGEGEIERKRTVKLFCPSLSKIIHVIARDEQKLDLGSIARAFGLDPATVKLNGHFISRGVDLIASSITWKSLISFFSARGLSTGTTDSDALIVDGRLIKIGSKRLHDQADSGVRMANGEECCYNGIDNKRFREANSGPLHQINQTNTTSLKRKAGIEDDAGCIKRSRPNHTISGFQTTEGSVTAAIPNSKLFCSDINKSMKRMGDEAIAAVPFKKLRR